MTLRRSSYRMLLGLAVGLLAMVASACKSTTEPAVDLRAVAGTYVLDSARGWYADTLTTGTMVLTADGQATRRVRSLSPNDPGPDLVAVGTYSLVGPDSIAFALRFGSPPSGGSWRVRAARIGTGFRFGYSGPADGEIVETYSRRTP